MAKFDDENERDDKDTSRKKKVKIADEEEPTADVTTDKPPDNVEVASGSADTGAGAPVESSRKRRSTLLGNLTTEGRLSRGYSQGHLARHLTRQQRQRNKTDETFALPPDDYYLMEEHDNLGLFLEKSELLPGDQSTFTIRQPLLENKDKETEETPKPNAEEGDALPTDKTEEVSGESHIPADYVFPIQRNAVELQSKLNITRTLKSYQQYSDRKQDLEGKCYYNEDEVDLSFLTSKPYTFLILGKPGIGKTTLGAKLAEKMHSVHLNPENLIEYFRGPKEPLNSTRVNERLGDGYSISDGAVMELLLKRIREFDVLHRGYVLEGFPMVTSDDQPVDSQLEILTRLQISPDYLIVMQMHDKDLYKRRINQKLDPDTGHVYTKLQYSKYEPDELAFNRHYHSIDHDHASASINGGSAERSQNASGGSAYRKASTSAGSSENPMTEEQSDTENKVGFGSKFSRNTTPEDGEILVDEVDFPMLPTEVLERLFYRTEDFNIIVSDDLESYRYNIQDLQDYVNRFDKRKVLEVDAYWSPTIIFRRVWEFCEAVGIQPVPVPLQIMRPTSMMYFKKRTGDEDAGEDEDEDDDESDDDDADDENTDDNEDEDTTKIRDDPSEEICEEEDEQQPEIDWKAAMRAVCVRGLVDPRFRWRISRWQNLCPVALKLGRSTPGKPELTVSFMDKVFFMSTKHAAEQFINNPRPYLLPKMPTSPIKFIVLGHPLAGKTCFAKQLAQLTDGVVIDIDKEVNRRFPAVKRDFIWKKRLKYALEATHIVNRENLLRWQRQEKTRRRDMHAWIENHLKALAEAEIEAALERDRDLLHKLRQELRKQSEDHAMGEPLGGYCQPIEAKLQFNWRKFVSEAFGGKREWTHQETLQLAWDLFHQRRLYYKTKKKDGIDLKLVNDFSSTSDSDDGWASPTRRRTSSTLDSIPGEGEFESDVDNVTDDLGDSDEDESDRRRKRRKKKQKKKCVRLEVKPVEPEDVVEPFLFEQFDDLDPEDPEVEESVRMRFPMIPFELVDLVPSPPLVGDLDPVVQMIVDEKLEKDRIDMSTMPVDIFVEILKRACAEIEVSYKKRNRRGALSGGWVIDNFPLEIEKWRAVLRTPQVCPDQVFLLLDLTEGNMTIWSRFKKLYKLLHPPASQTPATARGSSQANSGRRRTSQGLPGEGGGMAENFPTKILMQPRLSRNLTGEDQQIDNDDDLYGDPLRTGSDTAVDLGATDIDTENEGQAPDQEVSEDTLELVSKSHFMLSLLPRDDLIDDLSMTSSEKELINRDLRRNQTQAFTELASSEENFLEKLMQGHEKYTLESVNKEFQESEDDDAQSTWSSSIDIDDIQRRKEAALKMKKMYGEMTVCLEEVDPFNHQQSDAHRVSSDMATAPITEAKIKNPPTTPETGGGGHNSDIEDNMSPIKTSNWAVPIPSAIARGEIELSPEEFVLKAELENDIRQLSASTKEDDYVKTPTEMGSAISLVPETAQSGEGGGYSNPVYRKLLTTRIESPKRKFFAQIRIFNEFWNMALPVCNQQHVRSWEVGLCDEETAMEKSIFIWNEMESRFDAQAQLILETELREEDEEILESLMKWGQPFQPGDIRYRAFSKEKREEDEDDEDEYTEDDSEVNDDDRGSTDDSESEAGALGERDELTGLENKPNLYWKALKRREAERCFGDLKYYCPVTLADFKFLRKGSPKYACKFKDRLYYCADENSQLRFLTDPKQFLSPAGPPTPPPPRICITGSPGCLQEEIAQELCTTFRICYINFRSRLHEILHARFEKEVGPENTMKIVAREENERALRECKPGDDWLHYVGEYGGEEDDDDDDRGRVKFSFHQIPVTTSVREHILGLVNIPSQEILGLQEQKGIHDSTLKSLGLLSNHKIETIPLNSFERTEQLTDRRWEKLTRVETHIKGFLENGIQLPDDVLDHFILPLWKEKPFTKTGFILVGFPNTHEDVQYMIRRNIVPEHVFVMECKSVVIRNRLIVPAVDRWHRTQNPSGKKQRRLTIRTQRAKHRLDRMYLNTDDELEVFPYQLEGRPEVDEFERETWSYNDAVSRDITRALKFYHSIYSMGLEKMKKTLNKDRIDWTPVDTNSGLYQGKHHVLDAATPILKYRNNIFEDTIRLSVAAAQALLDRGIFTLSQLQRWCPVEISKGNTGINMWNAPAVKKIPYLHRRFIYFIAGEKNAKFFEENTLELTNQVLTLQPSPLVCMVLGMPKSGKTTLAQNLASRLGLLYVSCQEAVESVLKHQFVTEWSSVLYEVNPALASTGHQPMTLSKEIMEYIREGRAIPRFLVYRCLDQILMSPKAQYSGVVFDDFPTLDDELIELNYREMTPCIVLHLRIPIEEAYARCDRLRSPELAIDELPQEGRECIDFLWDQHGSATEETMQWFQDEYQNIHNVDGQESMEMVFRRAAEICEAGQKKIQLYLKNVSEGKPNTLDGTCPITSTLFRRLTPDFGFFCPVALNDADEMVSVKSITDLSQVVEYKGQIFLFSSKNAVRKFLNNPKKYTVPSCLRTPPKEIPRTLEVKQEDFERLQDHWGFMDFDPVLYHANHHFKGLQRGDPKYCVVYRNKLYVFINEANQSKFLIKPNQYWNLLLPMKLPRKSEPINYQKVTPYSYLSAKGMIPMLRKLLKLMAEKRPRGPFMSADQCAALYMGYYLKSQNMNSHFRVRQKYRDAMFEMSSIKRSTKDFLTELQNYYGCRARNMPDRVRKQLNEFVKLEHMPIEKKVLIPKIPGVTLGYDAVVAPFNEAQVTRKVRRMMGSLQDVEVREHLDAFKTYSNKKKAMEDAAARAAQDAMDAAELAQKMAHRAQLRLTKARSRGADSSSGRTRTNTFRD